MHHKRKGPKSTRSGCLLCKRHKRQGVRRITKVKGQTGRQSLRCVARLDERSGRLRAFPTR